jgi:hypothetical protein
LILNLIYIVLLSGLVPLFIQLVHKPKLENHQLILFGWFVTKIVSDFITFICYKYYHLNIFPVFHVSVLIENLLLVAYFNCFNLVSKKIKRLLLLIPIFIFFFEISIYSSIFKLNSISILTYTFSISILMLLLLFHLKNKSIQSSFYLIAHLFLFHSVSFIYFLFEKVRRLDTELTSKVFPIYFCFILFLNLHYSYYLWLKRKS